MKTRKSRVRGSFALLFGFVGTIVAIAAAAGAVWFGIQAPKTVENVLGRVEAPIERVDARLEEAQDSVESADALDVVRAQVGSVAEATANVTNSVQSITDSPLYGRLPIDTSRLETRVNNLHDTATGMSASVSDDDAEVGAVKGPVIKQIESAQGELGSARDQLDGFGKSLKNWVRISAVGGFFLAIWGMFGQLGLARWGMHLLRGYQRATAAGADVPSGVSEPSGSGAE